MMRKRISAYIIIHLVGFLLVVTGSLVLIAYNGFHSSANNRFGLKELLKPQTWWAIVTYREQPKLNCQPPDYPRLPEWLIQDDYQVVGRLDSGNKLIVAKKENTVWSIYEADDETRNLKKLFDGVVYPRQYLSRSYGLIRNRVSYPDCDDSGCQVKTYDLKTKEISSMPAFTGPDKVASKDIDGFFFDEQRGLVSYQANVQPDSPRLVINDRQELLQTIFPLPASNRQLEFKWYQPDQGYLVYYDSTNQLTYFYLADKIGLWRKDCRK